MLVRENHPYHKALLGYFDGLEVAEAGDVSGFFSPVIVRRLIDSGVLTPRQNGLTFELEYAVDTSKLTVV